MKAAPSQQVNALALVVWILERLVGPCIASAGMIPIASVGIRRMGQLCWVAALFLVLCVIAFFWERIFDLVFEILNGTLNWVADALLFIILMVVALVKFVLYTKTGNLIGAALIAGIAWWQWNPLFAVVMGVISFFVLMWQRRRR